jgi:hypothetical protein
MPPARTSKTLPWIGSRRAKKLSETGGQEEHYVATLHAGHPSDVAGSRRNGPYLCRRSSARAIAS